MIPHRALASYISEEEKNHAIFMKKKKKLEMTYRREINKSGTKAKVRNGIHISRLWRKLISRKVVSRRSGHDFFFF